MADFDTLEEGPLSRPADLYRFSFGTETFLFTSANETISFVGTDYEPLEIKRSSAQLNPRERRSTNIQLDAPADARPFSDFIGIQPALRLELTIDRIQLDEKIDPSPLDTSPQPLPIPTVAFRLFEGYVTSIAFKGRICMIDLSPFTNQFAREVPRFKYHSPCNHVLYDTQCGVQQSLFTQAGVVTAAVGNTITVTGFTGTAFTAGFVQNAAGTDFRMIIEQVADVFTLLLPFREILGETVDAFQGCDHTVVTCRDKFNAVPQFGGFPLVPGTNPFNQSQFVKT